MYHGRKEDEVSLITKEDAAYAFVRGIDHLNEINKKTFNVTSDETILYKDLLNKILLIHGISIKYILNRLFVDKNYYSPTCKDGNDLNQLIDYKSDTLSIYWNRLRSRSKNRKIQRLIVKPFIKDKK